MLTSDGTLTSDCPFGLLFCAGQVREACRVALRGLRGMRSMKRRMESQARTKSAVCMLDDYADSLFLLPAKCRPSLRTGEIQRQRPERLYFLTSHSSRLPPLRTGEMQRQRCVPKIAIFFSRWALFRSYVSLPSLHLAVSAAYPRSRHCMLAEACVPLAAFLKLCFSILGPSSRSDPTNPRDRFPAFTVATISTPAVEIQKAYLALMGSFMFHISCPD